MFQLEKKITLSNLYSLIRTSLRTKSD